jgi:hypothetical protein
MSALRDFDAEVAENVRWAIAQEEGIPLSEYLAAEPDPETDDPEELPYCRCGGC